MAALAFACQKPRSITDETITVNGLLNFSVSVPGQTAEYAASKAGPYEDGDTLIVKMPTSDNAPLDVTRLKPYASLGHNAVMTPALPGIVDFTEPLKVTVRDGNGNVRTNFVKVVPTLPKTVFSKLWFKKAQELGIKRTNISGMTVAGDHLLVADFNVGDATDPTSGVRVYNRETGVFNKIVPPPTTFTMQVKADDAGHFAVNRYNVYGAGFMLYYYEDINSAPKLLLNYAQSDGCPVNLGEKMSIRGNLKQGKAYVYATSGGSDIIYYWELNDGVPASKIPRTIKFGAAGGPWTFASVRRKSMDAASGHYITYCHYDGGDADRKKGSRFAAFTQDMNITQLNRENHDYKILDFEVFTVNGDTFLAVLQQGFWAWDATSLKVFEITNEGNLELKPSDAGYRDFMLLSSDIYGGTNYNRLGDVAVGVAGNNVVIYATMATTDAATAGVMAYRMTYNPQ